MLNRWAGPLITALIILGVVLILVVNLKPSGTAGGGRSSPAPASAPKEPVPGKPGRPAFREYPIGDEAIKNHMRIAAVWLPPIAMDDRGLPGSDVIHLEADVRAEEGNPNGFARDEFIPYLKIAYQVLPAEGGKPLDRGDLIPMIAADGLHYGASLSMPKAGHYRLVYDIQPPSAGGLGRHSDPATGVAPWWEPFQVSFDWDYPGPPGAPAR